MSISLPAVKTLFPLVRQLQPQLWNETPIKNFPIYHCMQLQSISPSRSHGREHRDAADVSPSPGPSASTRDETSAESRGCFVNCMFRPRQSAYVCMYVCSCIIFYIYYIFCIYIFVCIHDGVVISSYVTTPLALSVSPSLSNSFQIDYMYIYILDL